MEGRGHQIAASVYFVFGEFDNQNGVFGGQSDQHHQSDLEINIVLQSAERDAEICAEGGYRKGQQYGDGYHPTLIQGCKEQENEDEHEHQHEAGLPARLFFLIGQSAPFYADVVRQMLAGHLFDDFHGLPRTVTVGSGSPDNGTVEHVETFDAARSRRIGSRT